MAEEGTENSTATTDGVIDALVQVLKDASSDEVREAQLLMLRRLALSGDVVPSRLPQPQNITEIGGYLNLLDSIGASELKAQVLASVLGVAGPNPPVGLLPTAPVLWFAQRSNHRPEPHQAETPVFVRVRSDFADALDTARATIASHGAALPLLSPPLGLPQVSTGGDPPTDLLPYIGRTLTAVPAAALGDPDADALAVARLSTEAAGTERVVARVLDAAAPDAASVTAQDWTTFTYDRPTDTATSATASRTYFDLTVTLAGAGWTRLQAIDTGRLGESANWARWVNITGLIAGETKYGDELALLFKPEEIAASTLRERSHWVWNGIDFAE